MKKLSRLESNKEVRRVLVRNFVDLSWCQYSCSGREVRLTGSLFKIDGTDFNNHQIQLLLEDFARHLRGFTVNGELENWHFTQDHITALDENKEKRQTYFEDSEVDEDQDDAA